MQLLDASNDPVEGRLAAEVLPLSVHAGQAVDADPDADVVGDQQVAPCLGNQRRLGLHVVMDSARAAQLLERFEQGRELLLAHGKRLIIVPDDADLAVASSKRATACARASDDLHPVVAGAKESLRGGRGALEGSIVPG